MFSIGGGGARPGWQYEGQQNVTERRTGAEISVKEEQLGTAFGSRSIVSSFQELREIIPKRWRSSVVNQLKKYNI